MIDRQILLDSIKLHHFQIYQKLSEIHLESTGILRFSSHFNLIVMKHSLFIIYVLRMTIMRG